MPRILGSLAAMAFTIASAHAADLAEGIDLYRNHCAACHGAEGDGDGPAAPAMRTPVPSLRVLARRNGDVFPTDAVTAYIDGRELKTAHGNREMPTRYRVIADLSKSVVSPSGNCSVGTQR